MFPVCAPHSHVLTPSHHDSGLVFCYHHSLTQPTSVADGCAASGHHAKFHMTAVGPFLAIAAIVLTGGLLWVLAVVILEISCGVKLVLQKHVEKPFQRGDNGSALDLINLLRHVFVLIPLTVFLAYAAWIVEAAAICLAAGVVFAYYVVLQRVWPEGSLPGCAVWWSSANSAHLNTVVVLSISSRCSTM